MKSTAAIQEKIALRLLIDLNGYDIEFIRRLETIFEIDTRFKGESAAMLVSWINTAVTDIVSYYSISPTTLAGSINMGIHPKDYPGIEDMSDDKVENFNIEYKAFATNVFYHLGNRLEKYVTKAIDMGYNDVSLSVNRFRPGVLVLDIYGIDPSVPQEKDSKPWQAIMTSK